MTNSKTGVSRWVDQKINVETVGDEIRGAFLKSAFDDRYFLPLDELCDILCRDVVRELLHQSFNKEDAEEMEFEILGRQANSVPASPMHRRIFAILILVEKVEMIQDLGRKGIDDTDLPFIFESGKPTWRVQSNKPEKRESFAHWPMKLAHDFCSHQQEVHVPFFKFPGDNICFYPLESNSTLPFLTNNQCAISGYSIVHRVSIHKAHHNYSGQTEMQKPRQFAVKKLHLADAEAYHKEVHVFEKLGIEKTEPRSGENGREEKLSNHLIPLLLAYSHGKDYYLMFPWADGNLKQFWEVRQAKPSYYPEVLWFFNQCWGIARGLGKIHHLSTVPKGTMDASNAAELVLAGEKEWGRHGDVKPENILWFADYDGQENHLVISDFGLTRFNSAFSRSKVLQEQIQGFSGTYRPPDLHLDETITQKYDVWSLGCVLLEFVSWFLLGYKQTIDDFTKARVAADKLESPNAKEDKFFVLIEGEGKNKGKNGAEVKSSVIEWIKKLHSAPCCTEPLHSVLDLIQYTMLVPAAQHRLSCDRVRNELREIFQRCESDEAYALKPTSAGPDKERYTCLMVANRRRRSLPKTQSQQVLETSVFKPNQDPANVAVVAVSATRNHLGSLELEANETPVPHNRNSRTQNDRIIQEPSVESQRKISRILTAKTTGNTFSDGTSQDNGTTYTLHTDPCTTQQEMNRVGAQFDDDIDSTGVCKDITASINELPESKSLVDPQSNDLEPQNPLLTEVLPDENVPDDRYQ
ncbi:serine threonine kinase [Fusarium albosuccineum]|uniref:Serine threonine kinase n=1 Tax=Fusarium albosuccineum TaxID=1237068 RepID=A0A8H4PDF5_9HYPO|nr:serine threonine kinase [Fusarium albosuccineum]